jgi:hypothetical protein
VAAISWASTRSAGLGFALVGDGGGADVEIALGEFQLLRRAFWACTVVSAVLGGQHVEVGLADAHDQVLCGGIQLGRATSTPRWPWR